MKSTGIVRKMDPLGRIVLPMELRKTLDINPKDAIEIFTDDKNIVLRKYTPGCMFCGSVHDLGSYKGNDICVECANTIKEELIK